MIRILQVGWVLWRAGAARWLRWAHQGGQGSPPFDRAATAERIRAAVVRLGPIAIKFAQVLSVRADVFPEALIARLSLLQDRVPAFSDREAMVLLEARLGRPVTEVFSEIEETPLGAASLAQVYGARLRTGESVVIKLLRPGVERQVARDLRALRLLVRLLMLVRPRLRRLRLHDLITELEHTLEQELDLLQEAAHGAQLRRNFSGDPILRVPQMYWEYSRSDVLVMERIDGVPILDLLALRTRGVDLQVLAHNGVEIFFTQVLRDRFFHADMHPGNVFVDVTDPKKPRYAAVDFGIMGTLSAVDQYYLSENFLAFFTQNYRRVAELHVQCGWVPADTRIEAFANAIRCVCEPILNKPLREISFGQTFLRLLHTAQRFEMEVQPQLFLLQKTLWTIEGLGRQLDPDLDLWHTARPHLERWVRQRPGPREIFRLLQRVVQIVPNRLETWIARQEAPAPPRAPVVLPPARRVGWILYGWLGVQSSILLYLCWR